MLLKSQLKRKKICLISPSDLLLHLVLAAKLKLENQWMESPLHFQEQPEIFML